MAVEEGVEAAVRGGRARPVHGGEAVPEAEKRGGEGEEGMPEGSALEWDAEEVSCRGAVDYEEEKGDGELLSSFAAMVGFDCALEEGEGNCEG